MNKSVSWQIALQMLCVATQVSKWRERSIWDTGLYYINLICRSKMMEYSNMCSFAINRHMFLRRSLLRSGSQE